MLSEKVIKESAVKWQTSELNVAREYLQHLFLSCLYARPESEGMAFKGGTALRVVFGSPRFSEDLDFSANITAYHIEEALKETLLKIEETGLKLDIEESKQTSGGYLSIYHAEMYDQKITVSCNVSLRKKMSEEAVLVSSPLLNSYQCLILATDELVSEKVQAALTRQKPRDFFDLYFLIRERRGLKSIIDAKKSLLVKIDRLDPKYIQRELKIFLPVSYHKIISSLPQNLKIELQRL